MSTEDIYNERETMEGTKVNQPNDFSWMPDGLRQQVQARRAMFAGWRMQQEGAPPPPAPETPAPEAPAPEAPAPEAPKQQEEDITDESDISKLPPKLQAYISKLRGESAEKRTKARDAESQADAKIKAALKALGIEPEEDKDPLAAAQAQATEQQQAAESERAARRDSQAELIIWRNAAALNVDAAAITDSRAFGRAIEKLDPDAADFAQKVKDATAKVVREHPVYAAQAARKGGADLSGRGGSGKMQPGSSSLEEALAAKLNN